MKKNLIILVQLFSITLALFAKQTLDDAYRHGETEAEATLKLCVHAFAEANWEYVSAATEGAEIPEEDSAFSVFVPRAGEDLWQVAKRLGCPPEELQSSNPELVFPLQEGERIFVYRQIK